jgi:hypothetical protein
LKARLRTASKALSLRVLAGREPISSQERGLVDFVAPRNRTVAIKAIDGTAHLKIDQAIGPHSLSLN